MIHKVRKALGLPIAIMLDTKGPEYRICTFKNKKILLQDGDAFTFTTRQVEGDETIVGVSYAGRTIFRSAIRYWSTTDS